MSNKPNNPNLVDLSKVSGSRNLPMQTVGPEVGRSQYDYNITPNNLEDLNEYRAARQSALDKVGNGLTNMIGSAFTGAAESTVGFVYGVSSAIVNQDADKLWKNGFTDNFIDPINNWTKENAPFYYSQKEQDASLLGSMGYQNFWFDKVLGGAGYTFGSLAAGYGLQGLFGLSKGAAVTGKALSETITSAEALKSVELAGKLQGRIDMGKQFMMGGIMAHGESAMEARQTYEEALKNGMSEQQARDAANTNYIMNLAITGPTDMMLLGKWVNPGAKEAIKDYNKITKIVSETGEVTLKDATLDNARRGYVNAGKKFLEGFVQEGGQEGLQYASNIASQAFVKNHNIKGIGWLGSLTSGLEEGLGHLSDREGLESMLVGGITGGPFGIKGARSERLAREANTQKRINAISTDPEFLQGGSKMANYILATNALQNAEAAKQNKDLFEAKNQEAYAFGKYVQGHIDTNTTDLLIEKLNTLKQAPVEEFNQFFGFKPGDTKSQAETIDKLTGRIQKLQNLHDNITRAYGLSQGTPDEIADNKWLRNALFEASFTIENKEERENKMAEELTNITRNPALEVARKALINSYKGRDFDTAEKAAKEWEKLTEKSLKGEAKVNVGTSYKDFRDTQRKTYRQEYNALVEKTLDENPTLADDITSLLGDLNKNAEERETLIKYLNALRDPKSREAIKPIIQKGQLQEAKKKIKEAFDKTASATTPTPSVTTAEDSANIFPTGPEQKEKFVKTPAGEQVDVGNMSNDQVAASREAVIQEMGTLDPASPEFQAKQAYAAQLEEELNLRTNGDAILKNLRARYMAASIDEKRKIMEEAASKGFPINLAKYEEDLKKHEAKNQAPAVKQEVNSIDEAFSKLFKGTGEFQDVVIFSKGEEGVIAREAFNNLKEDPDFKNKITIEVQRKTGTAGPITYGGAEATQHPTLGKQRSNFNIIVKYAGTPIGFVTFYDTFVNKQTGKTVDILNMGLDEFKQLFNKDATAADLSAFQNTYRNALMFHNYVTSNEFLKDKDYATIPVGKVLEFINPYLTSGSITKVQENEEFIPLSSFDVHTNSKGELTIVDTKETYISSLSITSNDNILTYATSNTEAYIPRTTEDGMPAAPDVNPELANAFSHLSELKKKKKTYSRYWALVEDTGGSIEINNKKYRWTALTPSAPFSEGDALMKKLNDALNNDPGSPEARGEVKKKLNSGLFIAFGDNGTYESDFRIDIQPDYGFTTKEGKQIPEGYTLQIFSPSFFRNKEKSGETNGVKWSIRNGDTLYLKATGRVESFDTLISKFEGVRLALSGDGGPLIGTTVLTGSSFKNNPELRIDKIPKDQLQTAFSSTTKAKRTNQKLAFSFNEKALIDVTPGGVPQPKAPSPKQPVTQPVATQATQAAQSSMNDAAGMKDFIQGFSKTSDTTTKKSDIEKRREYSFSKELGVTKGVDDKIGGLYVSENDQERITGNSIQEVTDKINAKYDLELLKLLEDEMAAGKMVFDFTPAEQELLKKSKGTVTTQPSTKPAEVQDTLNALGANGENVIATPEELAKISSLLSPAEGLGEQQNNIAESIQAANSQMENAAQTPSEAANQAMTEPATQGIPLGRAASPELIKKGVKFGFTAEQINDMTAEEKELIRTSFSKEDVKYLLNKYNAVSENRSSSTQQLINDITARLNKGAFNVEGNNNIIQLDPDGNYIGYYEIEADVNGNRPLIKSRIPSTEEGGENLKKVRKQRNKLVRQLEILNSPLVKQLDYLLYHLGPGLQEFLKDLRREKNDIYLLGNAVNLSNPNTIASYYVEEYDAKLIKIEKEINAKYNEVLNGVKETPSSNFNFNQTPNEPKSTDAFSRVFEDSTLSAEEKINLTQAFAELRELLPDWITSQELNELEANIHKGIITLGNFQNNIIKLSNLATVGTQFHEAFHAVFRTMLSTQDQSVQYAIAKQELRAQLKQKGISYNAHKAEFLRLTPEAKNLAEPIVELIILEEYMADKFKDYMNKRKTTSNLRKFFDKILRLLGLMKTSEMDRLFAKIEKGGFKKATKVTSRFDSPMFKGAPANSSIFLYNNNNTGTPVYLNAALQTNEINKIVGTVLQIVDYQTSPIPIKEEDLDIFNTDSVDEMVDKLLNLYARDYFAPDSELHNQLRATNNINALKKYEDLMFLYNNVESRRLFKEEIFKGLNKFNIDENSDFSVNDSEISDTSPERNYDKNQEQVGGFGSLSKFMRRYIATTTYEVDYNKFFGTNIKEFENKKIVVSVDPNKVYNALTKTCQNQADINNVLNILADQLQNDGEASHFIAKFFADSNIIQDPDTGLADLSGITSAQESLVQSVAKAFNLWSLDYKFGSFDPNGKLSEMIDSNRRNVDKVQVNTWSNNYVRKSGTNIEIAKNASLAIQEVKRLLEEPLKGITEVELLDRAKTIQNFLRGAGMELSIGYIKHIILSSPHLENKTDKQGNKVNLYNTSLTFPEFIRNIEFIGDEIKKSTEQTLVNPYERKIGADKKERGAVTRAEEIAKDNAIFDESVAPSTFVNAEGKTIYSLQTDTYHIRKIFEIASSENWTLDSLRERAEQDPALLFFLGNPLLNSENFEAIKRTLKVNRIDGLRERSITYDTDSGENKINANKRQTEGVTYGSLGAREYAMLPYMLYSSKNVQYVNDTAISLKPVLITVMEASNTADAVDLPVVPSVNPETGAITNTFLDAMFNQLNAEHSRIKAFEQGKFNGVKVLNFNYGKKSRAAEFWVDNKVILEAIYGTGPEAQVKIDEITKAESLEPYKEEIRKGIEAWAKQEIDNHIEELIELGILRKSPEGNLENVLLPKGFSELLADTDPNRIFVGKADLKNNISQVYLSNMVNTLGINQLLSGDPTLSLKDYTDKFKRDRGANASGNNVSRINFPSRPPLQLKYGVYITPEFDEIKSSSYALGPTKIIPIYKPGTTEYTDEFKELEKDLTPDELKKAKENGEIAVADAQGIGTVALFREIYTSLGRMNPKLHEIFDRIESGEEISPEQAAADQRMLAENQVMLNSLKMVYYNGREYLKLSIAPLTKQATSRKNKNGKWVAQKGLEWEHDIREKMEQSGLHLLGPTSMSKKMTLNPIMLDDKGNLPSVEAIQAGTNILDSNYFRLQQENPSNKLENKDPTQMIPILAAEQDPTTEVTLPDGSTPTIGEVLDKYEKNLGYRVEEAAKVAKAFITELKSQVSQNKPSIKLNRLIQIFREVAAQSGASEKLLSVLELDQNGDPLYDINLPDVVTKFEEMFNAHFNKVFSQKIPGYKLTLQSGHAHNVIYNKATGKIVNRAEYLANPEAYEGDDYGTRELLYDQPRIVNGKEVGRYAEIIMPFHFAQQFGLKPGDAIPEEIAYLFGVRIPSQDKHSAMALKIVDILPPHYGSNAIFPKELILLTGSDFDIDSFYVHRPDHYIKEAEDGTSKFMLFGNKEDSAFEQHVLWHTKNNVFVKSGINIIKKSTSPLAQELKDAKQELSSKRAELSKKYAEKKEILKQLEYGVSTEEGFKLPVITSKIQAREYGREIKEIREELQPLQEKVKAAEKALALQAMRELNIPTTEEEFNKAKPKNPGALNNELLDFKIALHTNSYINKEITKTPATLRVVRDEILPELMYLLGFKKDGSDHGRQTTTYSMTGLLKAFVSNKAGSTAIGAAVNATQLYSVFSKYGLAKLRSSKEPYMQIDGITLEGVSKTTFKNQAGRDGKSIVRRIMDVLSTLTSSMTDNGKWLFNSKMNVDLDTLSVISYAVQQGVPAAHMVFMINNEYVNRFIKLSKKNAIQTLEDGKSEDERNSEARKALFAELSEKIRQEDPNVNFDALEAEPISYAELKDYLKYSSLSKNYLNSKDKANFFKLVEQSPDGEGFLKAQYKLLKAYQKLQQESIFLNTFSSVVKLTKGVVGAENDRSFSADDSLLVSLKILNIAVSRSESGQYSFMHANPKKVEKAEIPFDVLPIIQKDPLIKANLIEFFEKQRISREVFVAKTQLADKTRSLVSATMDPYTKAVTKRKTLRAFRRNFESYFNAIAFRKWWNEKQGTAFPRLDSMLFKDLDKSQASLQDQITKFVQDNPQFKGNVFFRLLKGDTNEKTSFENLTTNTRANNNPGFLSNVLNDYDAILTHNEEGRNLANNLFLYQLARYGLQYKNDSFVGLIATNRFKIISNNIKEMIPLFNSLNEDKFKDMFGMSKNEALHGFLDRFYSDINNSRAVRNVYAKSMQMYSFINKEGALVFPKSSELLNLKTNALLTEAEQTKLRNARHDYLGAVEGRRDDERSTAFPYMLKVRDKGVTTLYRLATLNGIPIKDVNLLEAAFKNRNDGALDGASATYMPINYTGSNISNNAFLPYSLTDEELANVTQHIQSTVGKDAVAAAPVDASSIDEFNDALMNSTSNTDVLNETELTSAADLAKLGLQSFKEEADSAFSSEPTGSLDKAKTNVAINVASSPGEKSQLNIADLKNKLIQGVANNASLTPQEMMNETLKILSLTDEEVAKQFTIEKKC